MDAIIIEVAVMLFNMAMTVIHFVQKNHKIALFFAFTAGLCAGFAIAIMINIIDK